MIKSLLVLGAVLAISACQAGTGPSPYCSFQSGTESEVCTDIVSGGAQDLAPNVDLPIEDTQLD